MWLLILVLICLVGYIYYYSFVRNPMELIKGLEKKTNKKDKHEYEYAFYFKDEEIRQQMLNLLKTKGAKHVGEFLMPLVTYDTPDSVNGSDKDPPYIRVRRENDGVKFTVKTGQKNKFVEEHQVEIKADDAVAEMDAILKILGLTVRYKVEKLRDIWILPVDGNDVEIVFDTYPGAPTYMEIEAPTEQILNNAVRLLGLDPKDHKANQDLYPDFFGISKSRDIPKGNELTFNNAKQSFAGMFTKNEDLFDANLKRQQEHLAKYHGYVLGGSTDITFRDYDSTTDKELVRKLDDVIFDYSNIDYEPSTGMQKGWIVEQNDEPIGYLLFTPFISKKYGNEWITLDDIGTKIQGKGIGSQIMNRFISYLDENNKPSRLLVEENTPHTERLIKWYKKYNYTILRTHDKSQHPKVTFTTMIRATPEQMPKI